MHTPKYRQNLSDCVLKPQLVLHFLLGSFTPFEVVSTHAPILVMRCRIFFSNCKVKKFIARASKVYG